MKKNVSTLHAVSVMISLFSCAMLFTASLVLSKLIPGSLPFSLYFSIVCSLLIILKLDAKISGTFKIRQSVSCIIIVGFILLLALLSAIDWIFLNLMASSWHYLFTVEGAILLLITLFFSIRFLSEPNFGPKNNRFQPTSEEKMIFG